MPSYRRGYMDVTNDHMKVIANLLHTDTETRIKVQINTRTYNSFFVDVGREQFEYDVHDRDSPNDVANRILMMAEDRMDI